MLCLKSPQCGGAPSCWNITLGWRSSSWDTTYSHKTSRWTSAVIVFSLKKNGPRTWLCITLHHMFTLELPLSSSINTWGFLDPQILKLCLFNCPDTWKVASFKKTNLWVTRDLQPVYPTSLLWILFVVVCHSAQVLVTVALCMHIGTDVLCSTLCTVVWGICTSLAVKRMDFFGHCENEWLTHSMSSFDVLLHPLRSWSNMDPVSVNF